MSQKVPSYPESDAPDNIRPSPRVDTHSGGVGAGDGGGGVNFDFDHSKMYLIDQLMAEMHSELFMRRVWHCVSE